MNAPIKKAVPAATVLAMMPIMVRTRVEELIASLRKTLGDSLESVIAFGSIVRGGYDSRVSNVDIIVVLREDTPEILESVGPALRIARAAARVQALIVVAGEVPRSADVFPVLYDDIRRCHAVLHGSDPFAGLVIIDEHIRLRIEQELRELRVELRRIVAGEGLAGPTLIAPLTRMVKRLRSPLFSLLALRGRDGGDDMKTVLRVSGDVWGCATSVLLSPGRDPNAALRSLRAVLDKAIDDVDTLRV